MTDPVDDARDERREAAARARQDPVLFGPDPFDQIPGRPPVEGAAEDEGELPRPRWPVIVGILLVVVVLVGAVGIWVR
jgi:hypothetical protein